MTVQELLSGESQNIEFKEMLPDKSFDQIPCLGLTITEDDVAALCQSMKETALKNCKDEAERAAVKDVTEKQLLAWGIIQEEGGKYIATNAYALLTGNSALPTAVQCGVFKGNTKAVFVDRREYTGPIQNQVEDALQFVLRNIHMGAEFDGLGRQDVYEIPVTCIRELLLNAVIHRSYLDHTNIQVALYDNRLEVTSPGKLPMGQSIERMKQGYSKIRNEAIAHAFTYMKLMEHWGSGIPRIIESAVSAGLTEPEFIDGDVDLRINVYRKQDGELRDRGAQYVAHVAQYDAQCDAHVAQYDVHHGDTPLAAIILTEIRRNNKVTREQIALIAGVSKKTVERELKKMDMVRYCGSGKGGYWEIMD